MPKVIGFYTASGQYGSFSNFYPASFIVDGVRFNCSEQFIMYTKAMLFGDTKTADKIMETTKPQDAKSWGRAVRPYDDTVWAEKRRELCTRGILAKFSQNSDICRVLLSTGDAIIAECAPRDRIWGIRLEVGDPRVQDPSQWRGDNLLGEILMDVRSKLRR